MFDFRPTPWKIQDDINVLSEIDVQDSEVNKFVASAVLKYVQLYFGARDIHGWLQRLIDRLEKWGGGFDLIWNPVNEAYALECLGDISTTSAIVKEIIFEDGYDKKEDFRSCDLGAGTGVLSMWAYISALRKRFMQGDIYLVDHEGVSVQKGGAVLREIVDASFAVKTIVGDIRKPEVLANIGRQKILFWISETISHMTPDFSIDSQTGEVVISPEHAFNYDIISDIDPFPQVVWNILSHNPRLEQDVKEGKVALFPDYVNGLYIPDGPVSSLELKSSSTWATYLHHVGRTDFSFVSDLDEQRRWWNI